MAHGIDGAKQGDEHRQAVERVDLGWEELGDLRRPPDEFGVASPCHVPTWREYTRPEELRDALEGGIAGKLYRSPAPVGVTSGLDAGETGRDPERIGLVSIPAPPAAGDGVDLFRVEPAPPVPRLAPGAEHSPTHVRIHRLGTDSEHVRDFVHGEESGPGPLGH